MKRHVLAPALLAVATLSCLLAPAAQAAITVHATQADFDNAVSLQGTDGFDNLSTTTPTQSPAIRMAGAHGYTVTATDLNTSGATGFYGAGHAGDPALSTTYALDSITFSSFTGSPTALAGSFFGSNVNGSWQAGSLQLLLTDANGDTRSLLLNPDSATTGSFAGFTSTVAMRSLQVIALQPASGSVWPTVDNFSLGVAAPVPEPATWASLLAGLLAVGSIARRRVDH